MSIRLIDPATGRVIFDSDDVSPEQLDSERDHILRGTFDGGSFTLQTPEQLDNELKRNGSKTCPECGSIVLTLDDGMWTCHGGEDLDGTGGCGHSWEAVDM